VERGLFFTGKESLVGEVDRLLRQGADVNSCDEVSLNKNDQFNRRRELQLNFITFGFIM
jgi:hypothetical protein